jgi:hypothetical protein
MLERVVPFISNVFYPVVPRIEMPKMVEWLRTVGGRCPIVAAAPSRRMRLKSLQKWSAVSWHF